ncbi:MAG: hypothetical protein JRJ09_13090 [Deltaproteobacteria bacterium]|nr:hypothetical protein [Deltaproteobacteria bacterium]MBW2049444.1 hypothetical protein [Deltaproteobacteria bacterium]MBW2112321.1 hypothetical protein [Deltaproteobacteria bacterium]MBW2354016.1 hypothetical protein [Deltaproteobacteria bacterium]HDZ91431.1 hypothetical protein [Deltaproteobacteria bacterium]
MKELKRSFLVFSTLLLSFCLWPYIAQCENGKNMGEKGPSKPIVINSTTLEADNKKRIITFQGDVEALMEGFNVYCQKMVIYYVEAREDKGPEEAGTKIDRVIATGGVKIVRAEGGTATGKKAVYYHSDQKLVLTGKPVVKQGNNFVEGDQITLFLKEDRSVVESLKDKKVRAVIFPGQEKGQGLGSGR